MSSNQQQHLGTWVFGSLLLIFLMGVFVFAPDELSYDKQRILAVFAALMTGLFGYFLTGSIALESKAFKSVLGDAGVKAASGAALFVLVLVWWFSPLAPVTPADGMVTVRLTVLSPQKLPVDDAEVWASVAGEAQKVPGGWELEIPRSKMPADKKITLYAAKKNAYLSGQREIDLKDQANFSTTIELSADTSAQVQGVVADAASVRVAGARISVLGHDDEATTTDASGFFRLPAHAAEGQDVRLHVEKPGYEPKDQYDPAGDTPAYIILHEQ
jgi:hypothetical protein